MYKKPLYRPALSRKERSGKVRRLSKDQIIREYGMKAVGKLSNREQVLWALKEHTTTDPESALSIREALEKAGVKFAASSHSAAMTGIWKKFGSVEGGMGLFNRIKKGSGFVYYKATPKVDDYILENFENLHTPKTEESQAPVTEVSSAAAPVPETTVNVNLKVTWDINLNFNGLKGLFK